MLIEKGILLYVNNNDYNTASSGKTSNDNKYDCDESLIILSNIDFRNG
jgi:hypothetical protein